MKKIFALIILAAMMITTFVITPVSAADDGQVSWSVYASAGSYKSYENETDPEKKPDKIPHEPGMRYTDLGVQMYVSEHLHELGWNAWGTIQTTDLISYKDGVTMTVVVNAFESDPNKDKWLSFSISNSQKTAQGDTGYGCGFSCLIRPNTNGKCDVQPFIFNETLALKYIDPPPQHFFTIDCDIYNEEALTFEVKKEDGKFAIYINDVKLHSDFSEFDNFMEDEKAYFSMTGHQGSQNDMQFTITEFNGVKPQGTDSQKPYEPDNIKTPGTKETTEPIEEGCPCYLWEPRKSLKSNSPGVGMTAYLNDDGSAHITFDKNSPTLNASVDIEEWYDAGEFPIFAILFRGLDEISGSGSLWYCAGDITSAQNDSMMMLDWNDYEGEDDADAWKILLIDISDYDNWFPGDRINGYRLNIFNDGSAEGEECDFMWCGFFRTEKDAMCYDNGSGITLAEYYNKLHPAGAATTEEVKVTEPAAGETEPAQQETEPAQAGEDTKAPSTDKPAETKDSGKPAEEKNNTWIIIVIIAAVVVAAGVACIFIFKKKK